MDIWLTVALIVHVAAALGIIGLVLLQHGKGADVGAAFGSGASGSLFGATGSANFLSRTTAVLAVVFFFSSLGLAYLANLKPKAGGSVMDQVQTAPAAPKAPAGDAAKPAGTDTPGSRASEVPK
jgi:preprotein translocase subunit SecG